MVLLQPLVRNGSGAWYLGLACGTQSWYHARGVSTKEGQKDSTATLCSEPEMLGQYQPLCTCPSRAAPNTMHAPYHQTLRSCPAMAVPTSRYLRY
eukprot:1756854-Rhodomonas_salina.2